MNFDKTEQEWENVLYFGVHTFCKCVLCYFAYIEFHLLLMHIYYCKYISILPFRLQFYEVG
jgi:hypothetical protein